MKLTTQLTIVIVAGITGMVAMVAFLSAAGWSEGGIAGMVTGIGSVITGLIVTVRAQAKTQETLIAQDAQLSTIEKNTNGRLTVRDQRITELERQVRDLGGMP